MKRLGTWWHRGSSPIGIDLGSASIKIAQATRDGDGASSLVTAMRAVPYHCRRDWQSHSDAFVSMIREMLREGGFVGRAVVGSLPDDLLDYRNLRLAQASGRAMDAAVMRQAEEQLKLPAAQYAVQFLDAGDVWEGNESRREIIVMAAPRAGIDQYLRLLSRCGMSPVAIDVVPGALTRAVTAALDSADSSCVLVDLGHASTTAVIVEDDRIRLIRRLGDGIGSIDRIAAERLELPPEQVEAMRDRLRADHSSWTFSASREAVVEALDEAMITVGDALATEVSKCLRYYGVRFRRPRAEMGFAVGAGAEMEGLLTLLRRGTGAEFRPLTSLLGADEHPPADRARMPLPVGMAAVAAGLSLYGDPDPIKRAAA